MKILRALAWMALVSATALYAEEGQTHGDHQAGHGLQMVASKTVEGEIVDITCYLRHQARGEEHIQCAVMCANMGMPLGVLEDETEQIYLIVPSGHSDPKEGVLEHIGKHVKVKGTMLALGGLTTLEIEEVREI